LTAPGNLHVLNAMLAISAMQRGSLGVSSVDQDHLAPNQDLLVQQLAPNVLLVNTLMSLHRLLV
jgi:hypothetical protein